MFEFILNNEKVIAAENKKLLQFLREDMNITSVKNGCSEGACGTCMVIVDGQAKKACVLTTQKLVGKNVITIEGMSERERDVYAYAFSSQGAVQCGFCIPGMVISAKALLDINNNPTESEIKKALKGNICRCTGYVKIIKAIELAAKIFREDIDVPKFACKGLIGENLPRIDAIAKALGMAEYVDDIRIDGMIYGSAVRTKYPRALVKKIDIEDAKAYPGVVAVLTAKDIPGTIKVGHLKKDWDTLIPEGEITRYLGDAIVLVAAETKEALEEAKKLVKIDYEELTPITCPEEALKEDAPKIKAAFTQPGIYEVRLGSGKWMRFENTLKNGDVNVMSQPAGTLNSIMFNDDGERVDDAKDLMSKNIIVADIGFGTFDPYGIINRKKALEESINNLGMKRVLEVASGYIYKDYHMDIRIPQMRKYMKEGFFKVIDIQNMSSKKVPLDGYIEKACKEVAEMSIKKLYEVSGYFADYDLLVVTGGTGAAWIKYFEEILSGMEGLEIIPGNHGNNLPIYLANVRGYYMTAYRKLKKAGNA